MDEFDQLLEAWELSTENFMKWAVVCAGVDKKSNTYRNLKETIVNVSDIQEWINFFDGNLDEIGSATEKYIEARQMV